MQPVPPQWVDNIHSDDDEDLELNLSPATTRVKHPFEVEAEARDRESRGEVFEDPPPPLPPPSPIRSPRSRSISPARQEADTSRRDISPPRARSPRSNISEEIQQLEPQSPATPRSRAEDRLWEERDDYTDELSLVPLDPGTVEVNLQKFRSPPSVGGDRLDQPDHALKTRDSTGSHQSSDSRGSVGSFRPPKPFGIDPVLFVVRLGPAKHPALCSLSGCFVAALIIGLGLGLNPPSVETDFEAFMKTDVHASVQYDAFLSALDERGDVSGRRLDDGESVTWRRALGLVEGPPENSNQSARDLQGGLSLYKNFDLNLAYQLNGDAYNSLFHSDVLDWINDYEFRLTSLTKWQWLCNQAAPSLVALCSPGVSIVNYAFSNETFVGDGIIPSTVAFTVKGSELAPLASIFQFIDHQKTKKLLLPAAWYDVSATVLVDSHEKIASVRTSFRFQLFCCLNSDPYPYQKVIVENLRNTWQDMFRDTLLPILQEPVEDPEGFNVRVWFDGTDLESLEVLDVLFADLQLCAGSMAFVFVYMVFHTRDPIATCLGMIVIVASVPLSYVVFAFLADSNKMSVASFLSFFLVVGLGADVVFVYSDFWKASAKIHESRFDRLTYTYKFAGKASLATTITTALSFFANLASVIRALREFGVYMGLCVMFAWINVTWIYVPLCPMTEHFLLNFNNRFSLSTGSPFAQWTHMLYPVRRYVMISSVVIAVLFLGFALGFAEVESTLPNLFPDDHNRNRGQQVLKDFLVADSAWEDLIGGGGLLPPAASEPVCLNSHFSSASSCPLFWCEAQAAAEPFAPDPECSCYRQLDTTSCNMSSDSFQGSAAVTARIVGDVASTLTSSDLAAIGSHVESADGFHGVTTGSSMDRSPILLEEWMTGVTALKDVVDVGYTVTRSASSSPCGFHELCYCSTFLCEHDEGYAYSGRIPLTRRLQTTVATVSRSSQVIVDVVVGFEVRDGTPLLGERPESEKWSFLPEFEARQPWAQRDMYFLCSSLDEKLMAVDSCCWISEFRYWLPYRGQTFPVGSDQFDALLDEWKNTATVCGKSADGYLWLRDGILSASFLSFRCDFNENNDMNEGLVYMGLWDSYIADRNAAAKIFTKGTFHVSDYWVRIQATRELINTTAITLAIVLGLSLLGMLVFTCNVLLSIFVVVCTIFVVSSLAFFIICIVQWKIGVVEVIALIVFTGYAITYSLHIAHKYGGRDAENHIVELDLDPESTVRLQRTAFSLSSLGGASLGSALTTVGSSLFLLGCDLTIFAKLGGVIIAVTSFSIAAALITLPSALLMSGPLHGGCIGREPPKTEQFEERLRDVQDTFQEIFSNFSSPRKSNRRTPSDEDPDVYPEDDVVHIDDGAGVEEPLDVLEEKDGDAVSPAPTVKTPSSIESNVDELYVHSKWNTEEYYL
mmetsp:Transcript_11540/g.32110  ORF Transcript_11540/g.32110 Transcript_11540/m.32110 type:complete len:1409 (-) Transcript_11540:477-4703(-)